MKLLQHLEVQFEPDPDNVKITCLWCGGDSLSIDVEAPHQYQCFKCKTAGNAFTYIRKFYDDLPALKKSEADYLCSIKKGIKPLVLRNNGVKYTEGIYWFPVYNQKGNLHALHKYVIETNIVYSSPKPTSLTVLGLQNLTKADTIWIAEGHWDYLTLMPHMQDTGYDLLGTCGSYFATNQLHNLKDKHIVLLYDNDTAGSLGINHVAKNIKSNTLSILSLSYLDWSKITIPTGTMQQGFDIRDLHNEFSRAN